MPTDKIKDVYDLISDKGYFADENEFRSYVNDPKKIKEVYSLIQDDGFFKDEKEFEGYFSDVKKKEPTTTSFTQSVSKELGLKPSTPFVQSTGQELPSKTAETTTQLDFTKPQPRLSAEEQQAQGMVTKQQKSEKALEFKEGVKQKLYDNNRYWLLQNKKEAQENGMTLKELQASIRKELANNYLDDSEQVEANAIVDHLDAKKSGDDKRAGEALKQYYEAKNKQRANFQSDMQNLQAEYDNIASRIEGGELDADFGLQTLSAIEKRQKNLEISQKAFLKPKEALKTFVQENATEIASVSKPTQTPYEQLEEYTNNLYAKVRQLKADLGYKDYGRDATLGGYAQDYAIRAEQDGGDLLDELYAEELKLKTATKLLLLNRTPIQADETALGVLGKSFGNSLAPNLQKEQGTAVTIANNVKEIVEDAKIGEKVYEEQKKYAEESAKPYETYSAKWFAEPVGASLAIVPEFIIGSLISEGALGVTKIGKLLTLAEKYGKIKGLNTTAKYVNAINKNAAGKVTGKLADTFIKAQANGLKFGATSEVVSKLFPSQEDELNFTTGYFGGVIGKGAESALSGAAKNLFKVFGNKGAEAAKKISELGGTLKLLKDAPKTVLGEVGEEFGESLGQIYKQSSSWKEVGEKIKEQYGTLDKATEFVVLTGIMALGMGAGNSIGANLFTASKEAYNNLPREQRAIVDSILDQAKAGDKQVEETVAEDIKKDIEKDLTPAELKEIETTTEETDGKGRTEEPISAGTDVLETGVGMAAEPGKEGVAGEDIQAETVPQAPVAEQTEKFGEVGKLKGYDELQRDENFEETDLNEEQKQILKEKGVAPLKQSEIPPIVYRGITKSEKIKTPKDAVESVSEFEDFVKENAPKTGESYGEAGKPFANIFNNWFGITLFTGQSEEVYGYGGGTKVYRLNEQKAVAKKVDKLLKEALVNVSMSDYKGVNPENVISSIKENANKTIKQYESNIEGAKNRLLEIESEKDTKSPEDYKYNKESTLEYIKMRERQLAAAKTLLVTTQSLKPSDIDFLIYRGEKDSMRPEGGFGLELKVKDKPVVISKADAYKLAKENNTTLDKLIENTELFKKLGIDGIMYVSDVNAIAWINPKDVLTVSKVLDFLGDKALVSIEEATVYINESVKNKSITNEQAKQYIDKSSDQQIEEDSATIEALENKARNAKTESEKNSIVQEIENLLGTQVSEKVTEVTAPAIEVTPTAEKTVTAPKVSEALKDVESTAKALEMIKNKIGESSDNWQEIADLAPEKSFGIVDGKDTGKKISDVISDAYHADKSKGKKTKLTKVVEKLLEESIAEAKPTTKPVAERIADLRAAEKAEYDAMSDPNDEVARTEIYERYNKLITPLIAEQKAAEAAKVKPVKESAPKSQQELIEERLNKISEIKKKSEGTIEERTKRYQELLNEIGDETLAIKKLQEEIDKKSQDEINKLPELPKTENDIINEKGESDFVKVKKDLGFKDTDLKWGDKTNPFGEDMGDMLLSDDKQSVIFIKPNEVEIYDEVNDTSDTITNGVKIELISTKEKARGKGKAKELIKKLTDWADKNNTDLYLDISPQDDTTTEQGLKKLYESFGFVFDGISGIRKPSAKEAAKPTKTERKAIAEAKIDDLAAKAKEFLRNKNLPEGTKVSGVSQNKVIDILASTVKALVNSGIEISEAIKQVRELFEQDFDTSAIKDYEINQAIARDELTDVAKENGFSSYREAVFAVNKYVREVGKEDVITKDEIEKAKEAKDKEAEAPKKGYTSKKKKAQEGEKGTTIKETGRSKTYAEGRMPVSDAYNDVVNAQREYYETMNQKATLDQAEEYLAQYGDTEQGLLDAAYDMIKIFLNNPYLDARNAIAIELLADRMFAKALDFQKAGDSAKYNNFLQKSEDLRREAFKAHYKAGQFNSAVAVFSKSVNPDAFLSFIDGQVREGLEDFKKTKPNIYEKYEQEVKTFQSKVKDIKKAAAQQAVVSAPNSTTKVNVKLSDKLKARYEQGKTRQAEALKKLGKINFFGSSGLSNEAIEAVGELVLAQFEQGIYKAATIIERIIEITDGKLNEKNIKDVYNAYKVNHKGEKLTLTELEEVLRKEELAEKQKPTDTDEALEKEREKLAKLKADYEQAVLDKADALVLRRAQQYAKDAEKKREKEAKDELKAAEARRKERNRIKELRQKEEEAVLDKVEALRLRRAQQYAKDAAKEREKQEKDKLKAAEARRKERDRIEELRQKEEEAQADRILALRLQRAQQFVKDQEKKVKEQEDKAKKAATAKTAEGKRPTLSDLIQRDLEADLTKEAIAKNLVTEGGLSEKEANKLADVYYNKYRKILKEKIQAQLVKDLTPSKVKEIEAQMNALDGKPFGKTLGGMIANQVAAGALDSETLKAAFAAKYGIPAVSPIVAANIRALSAKVRAAKTTLGVNLANKNLLSYINSTVKTKKGSIISTLYYVSILSGVSTALVNTYGNVNNLINQSVENFVQSVIEAKQGNKGNLMSNTQGAAKIRLAISNMVTSFTSFIDIMAHGGGESRYSTMKKGTFGSFESEDLILKKKDLKDLGLKKAFTSLLKLYKTAPAFFVRNLPASDEGFYMSNFNIEATRELRKKLYSEGLRGKELEKQVYEQVYGTDAIKAQALNEAIQELKRIGVDPNSRKLLANRIAKEIISKKLSATVQDAANELARENTFRGQPRGATGYLAQRIPQLWLITPFVSTPFKMAEKLINYIPLYGAMRYYGLGITDTLRKIGPIDAEFKRRGVEYAKREGELRNKQLAQVLTGHLLAMVFWGLSQIDWEDEDGKIVPFVDASAGYYGTGESNREKLKESLPEYTIRVGNLKFSYKTNPLLAMIALPFGVNKDSERSYEEMSFADWLLVYNFELASFLYESAPIKGLQQFFENIGKTFEVPTEDRTWEDVAKIPLKQAAALGANLAVDNIYKQIFDFYDPTKYVVQDNKEVLYKAFNMENMGGLQTDYDRWGRDKKLYPGETFFPIQYMFKDKTDKEITDWEIKNDVKIPIINRKTLVLTDGKLKSEKSIENKKKELIKDYGITSEEYKLFEDALNADYKLLTPSEFQAYDKTVRSEIFNIIKTNFNNPTKEYIEFYKTYITSGVDKVKPISELSRVDARLLVDILFDIKKADYINKNFTKIEVK